MASTSLHRGRVTPPATTEAFAAYLARCAELDFCGMLACSREGGEVLGVVNLSQIFYGPFCNAYLGYYAFTPHAGRGYLTEAVGLGLEHAFGPFHLHRVEANVEPDNARSLALLRRLGFRREGYSPRYLKVAGRWRDHERFAILAEEWQEDWRWVPPARLPRLACSGCGGNGPCHSKGAASRHPSRNRRRHGADRTPPLGHPGRLHPR